MLMTGKVLRFDEVRGYGFIAPSEPGEDVFMHANDLLDEKYLYKEGSEVEFFLEVGEKGPKASQIRLVYQPSVNRVASRPAVAGEPADGHLAGESESIEDFRGELTDALVDSVDTLTAVQIRQVRSCVIELARSRGWLTP
ncbi:cold shock domain-containing protein [Streptomyces sp. TRM68367]|uniref:cold shock domain-containing protein n=1 Tax=Streptomyces sp. TRM68367 TaxID=2758415 RepID=UPI00165C1247|nr:cold shock domain-containing protein [Streptomyces sp. TRM68367]MBC9725135.1 cold shock domain-containing protein [Streptomyces sp. TRM68367]